MGIFWKCARIGERLSPYISLCCAAMAVGALDSKLLPLEADVGIQVTLFAGH